MISSIYCAVQAANAALDRDDKCIQAEDCTTALNLMRREYRRLLGQSPYDAQPIPYDDKRAKLLAVYSASPNCDVPDPVLYSLLRARAVQEFNGAGWFGVHPLVVDILKQQGHLDRNAKGGTE